MDPLEFLARFGAYAREHREDLLTEIVDETYRSVPGYGGVPRDDLTDATRDTLDFLARGWSERRLPGEKDWQTLDTETVRRRIRQGVRAQDWIAHGHVFRQHVIAAAVAFGEQAGVPKSEILASIAALDEGAHSGTAFAATEFDAAADELLREDHARRAEFMAGLLRGALTPAAMRSGASALGLDAGALYRAVRIRPVGGGAERLLRAALRAEPTVDPRGAWSVVEDDVCGITQDGPPAELDGATAGVGPPVPLEAVATSYAVATTALETAVRFGRTGTHTIDGLGALPLIAGGGRAADALLERFVDDVERSGASGAALVETVAAYLERGLQVGETANALHLHVNSLRKRLRRYEELTGASLSSMDDLAAVWCAFKRRELDGSAPL